MTQKQLIETVKQHHPNLGETQIRIFLNKAYDEFCRKTKMLKTMYTFTSVANQRFYELSDDIIEIKRVDYDGYEIPRLVGGIEKTDVS
tara:strand:+ start:1186 stop:1449 length:264 start_codon:yes stop_codon:yes gene_type:complete